jgi:hypothetical protein
MDVNSVSVLGGYTGIHDIVESDVIGYWLESESNVATWSQYKGKYTRIYHIFK